MYVYIIPISGIKRLVEMSLNTHFIITQYSLLWIAESTVSKMMKQQTLAIMTLRDTILQSYIIYQDAILHIIIIWL